MSCHVTKHYTCGCDWIRNLETQQKDDIKLQMRLLAFFPLSGLETQHKDAEEQSKMNAGNLKVCTQVACWFLPL